MKKVFSFIAALLLYLLFYYYIMTTLNEPLDFTEYFKYRSVIFSGWINTIIISGLAVFFSLFVGLVLYLMQESKSKILFYIAEIHKTIIFGTPLLVLAIVSYYYIGSAFGIRSKFWVGVVMLALYIGAYICDIYKGAIESIHINQWQAATMFGFNKYQTYRYIIFPQVVKSILPPLAGQFALTVKGSALLAYMATSEYLNSIQVVQSATYQIPEGLVIVTIGYLLITVPLIITIRKLEQKAKYEV